MSISIRIYQQENTRLAKSSLFRGHFFKLIEICNTFDLFNNNSAKPITSFHLAEGPGSFIEALTYLRFNTKDIYYGMTLENAEDDSVPGWRKSLKFFTAK